MIAVVIHDFFFIFKLHFTLNSRIEFDILFWLGFYDVKNEFLLQNYC
jgi:hypothetical protein